MSGEDASGQVVEWWQPLVGQRIVVRLSGECAYCSIGGEDGQHGTVEEINSPPHQPAHRFWVALDHPNDDGEITSHFAAAELEPVESPAAREGD